MKTKLIHDDGEKTFAIIFDKGDEVAGGLLAFAKENNLSAGDFSGALLTPKQLRYRFLRTAEIKLIMTHSRFEDQFVHKRL